MQDDDENEWPPSPLRVFQSLVAAAAASKRLDEVSAALKWLEQQEAPTVLAPYLITIPEKAPGYCISVPNNSLDIVAHAWCRGNYSNSGDANPAIHRTMKTIRPILLPNIATVYYLWELLDPIEKQVLDYIFKLSDTARKVVALGWGIDMVVGNGEIFSEEKAKTIKGEKWYPKKSSFGDGLRTPIRGTLEALIKRHEGFLNRLNSGTFTPPPELSAFQKTEYLRGTDRLPRPIRAFSLMMLDSSSFRSYSAVDTIAVAAMVRHAASLAANSSGLSRLDINSFILGHGESEPGLEHVPVGRERLAYLPLPSIESRGKGRARVAGRIRRVLITSFGDDSQSKITFIHRILAGHELIDEKSKVPVAHLALISSNNKMVRDYAKTSAAWSTVTPVVLPGYDDPAHYRRRLKQRIDADEQKRLITRLDNRIDGLLRKAITQAGFPFDLAKNAEIDWRKIGFWAGTELADKYRVPQHLKHLPRYHVRIQWRDGYKKPVQVAGPICIGGGRFYGLGLFAAEGV